MEGMILDNAIQEQVRDLLRDLSHEIVFHLCVHAKHPKRDEFISFYEEFTQLSPKLSVLVLSATELRENTLDAWMWCDGKETGISFRALPLGHEFSSLLLAVLNLDGQGKNLPDAFIVEQIEELMGPLELKSYISLSCTNCPDVVQALNVIAMHNPHITHNAIDGALFPDEVEELGIQAVPSVYANGELLHTGRGELGLLLSKLQMHFPSELEPKPDDAAPRASMRYDLLIAGAGPAGATAAIYAARKGLRVALVAGKVGGQVNETTEIANISSIVSTTGKQLAADLRSHLGDYPIDLFENREVTGFSLGEEGEKCLSAKGGEQWSAPVLIIATGATWRQLHVAGEAEYMGRGVAFCPHCDGPFYAGKRVAVIGGGNSGAEAAIDLAGICEQVTLLEFMDELRADKLLQNKLGQLANVEVRCSTETREMLGNGQKLTGLEIRHRKTGELERLDVDGVFIQIGLSPNSGAFQDVVRCNAGEEIVIDKDGRTSLAGVYAAGDVTDGSFKQIIIAMGEGAKAALAASIELELGR